jgi:hypothetical protein
VDSGKYGAKAVLFKKKIQPAEIDHGNIMTKMLVIEKYVCTCNCTGINIL